MTLRRKPTEVPAWLLTDHDDKTALQWMFDAIAEMTSRGYRGTPLPGPSGAIERVEFNGPDPLGSVQATFGQWVVFDGRIKALSVEECAEQYDETDD